MSLLGPFNSGAAVGSAGSATINATTPGVITGLVMSIYVQYNDSPPATTDVTIATAGTRHPALTLLTLTNANTSGWFHVMAAQHDTAGAAVTDKQKMLISDQIKVTVAQADAGDSVDIWVLTLD